MADNKVPSKHLQRRTMLRQTAVLLAFRTDTPTEDSARWLTYGTIARHLGVTPASVQYWCTEAQRGRPLVNR
jgi:hypothetical protein